LTDHSYSGAYCVVIGGSNADLAGVSDSEIRMKDSNPGKINVSSGGVARNIAENLSWLGVRTTLLSCVGKDEFGDRILKDCRFSGIDISHIKVSEVCPTSVYLSLHDPQGVMQLAVNDMKCVLEVNETYLESHKKMISRAAVLVADTNLDRSVIQYLIRTHGDIPLYMDTVSAAKAGKLNGLLSGIDTLKPNRLEAEMLTGENIKTEDDLHRAMDILLDKGLRQVFISLGSEGTWFGNRKERGFLKNPQVHVVSTTGSGDAFMAGLVYSFIKRKTIRSSVLAAVSAACLALESPGSVSPDMNADRVESIIKKQEQV